MASARYDQVSETVGALRKSRLLVVLRPDKYLRIAAAIARSGPTNTTGIAMSARRCPSRVAVIDERGELTYRELDRRADALAFALTRLTGSGETTVGIMCRNHRGFVDALAATDRIGASALLLNTSFAGPALAEVVEREKPDIIVHDDEFTDIVARATEGISNVVCVPAWCDGPARRGSLDDLIVTNIGKRAPKPVRRGKLILLTSGTTGTPKGAKRSGGGGPAELTAVLSRVPWRAEETTVVAAPMFHAWGYGQLVLGTLMSCTLVMRRKFDPAATLDLVDRHSATGLSVVPVMLDRIMDLPNDVLDRHSGATLRFVTASGSRMRADVVTAFMDRFGDVIYNNYNATEAGMVATATPADLRQAPTTAGRPLRGVQLRILDSERKPLPTNEVGTIFVHSTSQFDSYTSGATKEFDSDYMATGDLGYLDHDGRLFVVGRDDDMIVSGGENVYPIEVEDVLVAHPAVAEASVVGVDDRQFGQRLVAFVVLRPSATATPVDLQQCVRSTLANFKVPRDVLVVDELPRTNTGKIRQRELRDRAAESLSPTQD